MAKEDPRMAVRRNEKGMLVKHEFTPSRMNIPKLADVIFSPMFVAFLLFFPLDP